MVALPFRDRLEAGRLLGAELASRMAGGDAIVVALPRGGLPVAAEVARALSAPLDIVVVRKLGVPWQPELAMGAMTHSVRILDHQLIRDLRIPDEEVQAAIERETQELLRREELYRSGLPPQDFRDKTVILVDDGLATGSTMLAAARHVRSARPKRVVIAVPVGPPDTCRRFKREADECSCLAQPEPFLAVGEWYADFPQVSDSEVREILARVAHPGRSLAHRD